MVKKSVQRKVNLKKSKKVKGHQKRLIKCASSYTHAIHLTAFEPEPCFAMYIIMLYMIAGLRHAI